VKNRDEQQQRPCGQTSNKKDIHFLACLALYEAQMCVTTEMTSKKWKTFSIPNQFFASIQIFCSLLLLYVNETEKMEAEKEHEWKREKLFQFTQLMGHHLSHENKANRIDMNKSYLLRCSLHCGVVAVDVGAGEAAGRLQTSAHR